MEDSFKKALLMSIGLVGMTKDKVEETARKIIKELDITEKEGKKLVDELVKKSEETKHALEDFIQQQVQQTIKKLNMPTKQEMDIIKRQIGAIEERITQ